MTRSTMSLTLLLMAGSVAAAVAAPELGLKSDPYDCVHMRAASSQARPAAPFKAHRSSRLASMAERSAADARAVPCSEDITEPYRLWHHGSAKLVAGCGALSAT